MEIIYRVRRLFYVVNDFELGRIKKNYIKRTDYYELKIITDFLDSIKLGLPLKNIIVWNNIIIEGSLKIFFLSFAFDKNNLITYYYDLKDDNFGYAGLEDFEELQIPLYWFTSGEYYEQFLNKIENLENKNLYINLYKNFGSNLAHTEVSYIEVNHGTEIDLENFLNKLK